MNITDLVRFLTKIVLFFSNFIYKGLDIGKELCYNTESENEIRFHFDAFDFKQKADMGMKTEKSRGDYLTRGYLLVKEVLKSARGAHLSADEIYIALQARGEKIGRTTVYRQLERLVSEGLVRRTVGEGGACFSFAGSSCSEHYHLLCTACGKLEHLSCEKVKTLFRHIESEHGFVIDPSRTTLYGLCAACATASDTAPRKEFFHAPSHT